MEGMSHRKYECKRCGRPFQVKEDEKEPACIHCGSKEVVVRPDRPAAPSSCGTRGRFS